MPKRKGKAAVPELDLTPSSLHLLKRSQLQQHCKRLGLKGAGKNAELIQRLQDHFKQAAASEHDPPTTPPPEDRGDDSQEQTGGRGWCVIHGQELTVECWRQLFLRCGRVCVTSDGACIPLHLIPSTVPTPCGLQDNLICGQCFERNLERESRVQHKSAFQDKTYPSSGQMRASTCRSVSRTRKRSGRFQPQEDPEYARRVDELLDQLATGKVDSQKILCPIRPAVLHSPLPKPENSPVPINLVQ